LGKKLYSIDSVDPVRVRIANLRFVETSGELKYLQIGEWNMWNKGEG